MSNIDKQALRNLARRATPGPWTMEHENIWYYENGFTKHLAYFCQGDDVGDSQDDVNTRYFAAADPTTVLALLDELEAKDHRIAELERKEQHSERQSVIDALASSGEAWSDIEEYMQEWDAARAAAAGKGQRELPSGKHHT